ncbi:dependent RNA helicase [Seminavis robusta]|uniref:Dependent RNA helicase n=1 Tax=Seminavis robusta TaxID=568900 RepID=A0A9N8HMA0_9STRA|nr:dependent RNA helicase [Seminavis robusta]|eukprot:Sro730_g194000.1 dependent RNA helicase (645) ;mRNA; r:19161-21215
MSSMRRNHCGVATSLSLLSVFSVLLQVAVSFSFLPSPPISTRSTVGLWARRSSPNYPQNSNNSNKRSQPRRGRNQPPRWNDNYDQEDDKEDYNDNFVQQEFEDYDDFDFDMDDDSNELPRFDIDSATDDNDNTNNEQAGAHFYSRKDIKDTSFLLDPENSQAVFFNLCHGASITRPSKIQSVAWPTVLKGKHTIIADQTGSGKTLAYLIPLLQRALTTLKPSDQKTPNGAPRILVLAPTAELADQVRAVCDLLSSTIPFSTMVVTATGKYSTSIRDQIRMLARQPVDVLISTPGRLSTIVRTRNSGLDLSSRLQAVVLDEVDILMASTTSTDTTTMDTDDQQQQQQDSRTFGPQLRTIGQAVNVEKTQFVFVTATLPDSIVKTVTSEFPQVVQVRGPGLHRVAPSLTERLIDVSVPPASSNADKLGLQVKAQQLLLTLRMTRCKRTLIFCNTVQSCRAVENVLKRSDRKRQKYDVRAYHNAMTPEARNRNLEIFSNAQQQRHNNNNKQDFDSILVCTDRAGRGVDFGAAPVDHVVLFDFPRDPAEYVRRVGRTARAGREGTCTVLAYGWQLPIARSVMGKNTLAQHVSGLDNDDDDNAAVEFRGGVQGRRQHKKKKQQQRGSKSKNSRDAVVKSNIEGGRLWKG